MSSVIMQHPDALRLLWAIPVLALLFYYAARKRRDALRTFADIAMLHHLVDASTAARRAWKAAALCLAFACLAAALAQPAWNPQPRELQREGRDVIFLLDISKSMLARDLQPSRLENAKAAISDCLDFLEGDRVALVAFAGTAAIQCPLTVDYAFFRMRLEDIAPEDLVQGGTRIGDAITTALEAVIESDRAERQDIVLISDGGDHDSEPEIAAKNLDKAQVRLIAIGLGDELHGQRIPVKDKDTGLETFLTHDKQEVWSKLEATTLRRIANATRDGIYLNVATGTFDLSAVYHQLISNAKGQVLEDQSMLRYEEKFQVFLSFALFFLLLAAIPGRADKHTHGARIWEGPGAAILVAVFCLTPTAHAETTKALVTLGNHAYAEAEYGEALDLYYEALEMDPDSSIALYNLGNTYFRRGDYESAMEVFEGAAYLSEDEGLGADAYHNLGNCLFHMAEFQRTVALESAADMCLMSARYYRAALELLPDHPGSAHNLEVAKRTAAALQAELKAAEEKEREIEELLEKILTTLEELIARQEAEVRDTGVLMIADEPSTTGAVKDQRGIRKDTAELADKMEDVNKLFSGLPGMPEDAPPELAAPLSVPRAHTLRAVDAQDQAIEKLEATDLAPAQVAQRTALDALKRALEAMPAQARNDQGESEPSDEEMDDEEEYEESEEEGDQQAEEVLPEEPAEDEEFTAPKETPEDILEEEQRNNLDRKKKRPGHYQAVDRDW